LANCWNAKEEILCQSAAKSIKYDGYVQRLSRKGVDLQAKGKLKRQASFIG